MEEDPEDDDASTSGLSDSSKDTQGPVAGGLSRALGGSKTASGRWGGRTFSLHNLLDQVPEENEAITIATGEQKSPRHGSGGGGSGGNTPKFADRKKPAAIPWDRKQEVIDGVNDLIEELKDIDSAIAVHAPEHIHSNEIILTFGFSRTVAQFLLRAKEKRDFHAVVAEGAPTLQGHGMALELARAGIPTTAIADAAVYAMMARVNKVIISAHAILADGGVMAPVGTAMVAAAAKKHNVPFVVLVGIYKLSAHFPHEPGVTFNDFREPSDVLPYNDEAALVAQMATAAAAPAGEEAISANRGRPFLQVHNPSYDYIAPELISLFLSDHGSGFMPSYVYRQLSEFYHRQDYELSH
jgi:translation initiation factor eIF-2B subunit beta